MRPPCPFQTSNRFHVSVPRGIGPRTPAINRTLRLTGTFSASRPTRLLPSARPVARQMFELRRKTIAVLGIIIGTRKESSTHRRVSVPPASLHEILSNYRWYFLKYIADFERFNGLSQPWVKLRFPNLLCQIPSVFFILVRRYLIIDRMEYAPDADPGNS